LTRIDDEAPDAAEPEDDGAPAAEPEQGTTPGAEPTPDEGETAAEPTPEPEAEAAQPEPGAPEGEEQTAEPVVEGETGAEAAAPEAEKPEPKPKPAGGKKSEAAEVVPGANLEPIAITEERELTAEERARLEAEAEERASREAAHVDEEPEEMPQREAVSVPADASIQATGKRKRSVARVILRAGGGAIEVNGRGIEDYFARPHDQSLARQPLVTAGYDDSVDVKVRVHGGGISGQAGAVRHGIARALCELDPDLRGDLKRRGLLTRDARVKERRKAGLKKARKKPQFSKR
jgi:small subunit ribosomal protein S9